MIAKKIQQIIDRRKQKRLPSVEKEIAFLEKIKVRISHLDSIINTISCQIHNKHGEYYALLQADPSMEMRFMSVSTTDIKLLIDEQLKNLENLKKRFSRDAVQIAFIGYERQGKSCCLKSISGLSNKVIPAYSGTSCTGAISVIHNVDKDLEVHIEFYGLDAFIDIIKEKLDRFFPKNNFIIHNLNDLKNIDLTGFESADPDLSLEFCKFKDAYIDHINIYETLIGQEPLVTSDENQIIQHVSQYEEFNDIPQDEDPIFYTKTPQKDAKGNVVDIWVRHYYKYIAVKSVNIYTRFIDQRIKDSKVVLVDTIGMGDASNAERIEDEMFRVLREDCDAAVNIFKPQANGDSFNKNQIEVLKKIDRRLANREPQRWIYYVLNRVESGKGDNIQVIPAIMDQIKDSFKTMKSMPVADVLNIDVNNPEEVNQRLISPLLDLITNNLDDIDSHLIVETNRMNESLYQEYKLLADAIANVVSSKMKQGSNEMMKFRELYKEDLSYSRELRNLDNKYFREKDNPCSVVKENIDRVISNLTRLIEPPSIIEKDVTEGTKSTNDLLEKYCKLFRNRIYTAFGNINTDVLLPLQDQIKDSLAQILFENGRLGRIPLQGYAIENGPSQDWLYSFIIEKVDKGIYPHMYYAFNFILDYQLNIEGLMEYNVARCLDTLDKNSVAFKPMASLQGISDDKHAEKIWSEIVNRTVAIQIEMRKWRDDFSLIPSHSFYARISMFKDFMVDDTDTHMSEELLNFYSDNRMSIWRDKFLGMMSQAAAFGKWNDEIIAISELCHKNSFNLSID